MKKNTLLIAIFVGVLVVALAALVISSNRQAPADTSMPDGTQLEQPPAEQPDEAPEDPSAPTEPLTKASCEEAGGTWNSCGSACRGEDPDTACIEVCVEMCECASDSECPSGYSCGEYIDGTGVCG